MAFEAYGSTTTESTGKSTVDYDALNQYVVETAALQNRETITGYVAGIVDLGLQELPDAEIPFTGSAEDEAKEIEKNPDTYFEDGFDDKRKPCRMKRYPQRPQQCVTLAIDFPEIMLNKGQFFGDDSAKELPLRLWLGGQFYMQGKGMVVGRPIPLRLTNLAEQGAPKKWSFKPNHTLYKMALGAKIINPGDCFLPKDIDKLIGKSLQFEAQVFMKESKGKSYFTEYVKYVSGLGRGQKELALVSDTFVVQMNQPNTPKALKELRNHIVNTVRMAGNYVGSVLEKELSDARPARQEEAEEATPPAPAPTPKQKTTRTPVQAPPEPDFDDDIPF
jgi:hypothetical protein